MALKTKLLISSILEVPREWIFEHYLDLGQSLTGQDVKMKSIFNVKDTHPSFFVYYNAVKRRYLFKDFSTGKGGDGTELVKEMFGLTTRGEAAHKIIEDYNRYVVSDPKDYSNRVIKKQEKYKVSSFKTRGWTKIDQNYWTKFRIGSETLEAFNVKPIESYTLRKEEDGDIKEMIISTAMIYGYFKNDGTLYKIYQPKSKVSKFIRVTDYIQGTEQLTLNKPYLVICSSLKDVMAFNKLGFKNAEAVAPDSENVLIPELTIQAYKNTYEHICTCFDNDSAGIKCMKRYFEEYNIPSVHLKLEKDLSDSIKVHGLRNTRLHIYPLLTSALTGTQKQLT